jgi:hypothetical protein
MRQPEAIAHPYDLEASRHGRRRQEIRRVVRWFRLAGRSDVVPGHSVTSHDVRARLPAGPAVLPSGEVTAVTR